MAKEMRTGVIRFNLKKRMRQFNGAERDFDIPALVKVINSPAVQERVKFGDLNGFYGHWARIKFGAEPQEGGVLNGQVINLEPCCRTVYLKAYDDGTVEHEQEFFNTDIGVKAYKRLQDRSGGFSSVISVKNGYGFHGFDFVNEPNYANNRPYALDSVAGEDNYDLMVLDDVGEGVQDQKSYIDFLLDSLEIYQQSNAKLIEDNRLLSESLERLHQDHQIVLDEVVILNDKLEEKSKPNDFTALDNVVYQAERFKTARLEKTKDVIEEQAKDRIHQQLNKLMARYGY